MASSSSTCSGEILRMVPTPRARFLSSLDNDGKPKVPGRQGSRTSGERAASGTRAYCNPRTGRCDTALSRVCLSRYKLSRDLSPLDHVHRAVVDCRRCTRLRTYCTRIATEKKRVHRDEVYW